MTAKNVTNKYDGALGLPAGGPLIPPGRTARVENWDVVSQHQVVKAWLDAGVLVVSDAKADDDKAEEKTGAQGQAPAGDGTSDQGQAPSGDQGAPATVKTKEELEAMTKDDLTLYIEKDLGGDAKSNMNKADLVALALDLQD